MARAKQKKITDDDIRAKKEEFQKSIEEAIKNKKYSTPAQRLLFENKEIVLKAVEKKVSYMQISKNIEEVYGLKINPQTIRIFVKKAG